MPGANASLPHSDGLLGGRMVLPRRLRPLARLARRLGAGEIEFPRFSALIMSAGLLASTVVYGVVLGGYTPAVVQALTARSGFAINEIAVIGGKQTSEIDIVGVVGLDGWTSLIGFSPEKAREAIAGLPWVKTVSVRKVYPATLEVKLSEREAFAIWQQGESLALIERDGSVIAPYRGSFEDLPLVIGADAATEAPAFLAGISRYPEIAERIKAYSHVGKRRWDLHLRNGVTVKLPETGALPAVERLSRIDAENGLLDRDVVAIDMRLPDRLVVQLAPEAVTARDAAFKERMEKIRKGRRT